jgi:serine/threonine protein kinase
VKGRGVDKRALAVDYYGAISKFHLSYADRIYLALGCVRGIVALHGVSPDLCHRDVKSMNFLVDHQMNVKIADLELGGKKGRTPKIASSFFHRIKIFFTGGTSSDSGGVNDTGNTDGDAENPGDEFDPDGFLPNWAAPEVLSGCPHSQASDVYGLGLVLWEIVAGMVPFCDVPSQPKVRKAVLNGERPEMPRVTRSQVCSAYAHVFVRCTYVHLFCSVDVGRLYR